MGLPLVVGQHPGFIAYRTGRLPNGSSVALTDLVETRAFRRPYWAPYRTTESAARSASTPDERLEPGLGTAVSALQLDECRLELFLVGA